MQIKGNLLSIVALSIIGVINLKMLRKARGCLCISTWTISVELNI